MKTIQKLLFMVLVCATFTSFAQEIDAEGPAQFVYLNDQEVAVVGTLGRGSAERLTNYLAENPDTRRLRLIYVPGSDDDEATRELLRIVLDRGLDTHVDADGLIASGGVDLWLAGRKRTRDRGAFIGVHSWAAILNVDEAVQLLEAGEIDQDTFDTLISRADENGQISIEGSEFARDDSAHQEYIEILRQSGVQNPEAFYFFTLNVAAADDIHNLTETELAQFMLVRSELFANIPDTIMGADLKRALSSVQGKGIGATLTTLYNADNQKARETVQLITPRIDGYAQVLVAESQSIHELAERQLNGPAALTIGGDRDTEYDHSSNLWLSQTKADYDADSNDLSLGYSANIDRSSIGYQRQFSDSTKIGFYASKASGEINFHRDGGEQDIDYTHIGLYGKQRFNRSFIEYSGAYFDSDGELQKRIAQGGNTQLLTADLNSELFSAAATFGFDLMPTGANFQITPIAGILYHNLKVDEFTEVGGILANQVDEADLDTVQGKLGIRAAFNHRLGNMPAALRLQAYWLGDLSDDDQEYTARFINGDGSSYASRALDVGDQVLGTATYQLAITDNLGLSVNYDYLDGDRTESSRYAVNLGFMF